MKLTDLIPTADVLLALAPEELAGLVLEYFHRQGDPERFLENPGNFSGEKIEREYGLEKPEKLAQCQRALMEAWSYLEKEGLIVREPRNPAAWFILSRRGKQIKTKQDYEAFRHANLFPKDAVHPDLVEGVYPLFLRGDYETAIFKAFKLVEVAVREAAGPGFGGLLGVDLMRRAFHAENGPLTDKSEPVAEREALLALFAGAIGRFKNPSSHRHVPIVEPKETIEMILLASHLLRVVDDRRTKV